MLNNNLTKLILVLAFFTTTLLNAASYTTTKGAVISIDPVDFINGRINATYESKLNAINSFTANATYWHWNKHGSAFGIGGSYRWYIDLFEEKKSALNGLSIGPRADFFFWSWSYDNPILDDKTYSTFAIGGEVNYKWVFDKWSVEPTIKFGIPLLKEKGYDYTSYGFGINLGYCF